MNHWRNTGFSIKEGPLPHGGKETPGGRRCSRGLQGFQGRMLPSRHPAQSAPDAIPGCAQRVALPTQRRPAAGRRLPPAARPRSVSRRPAGRAPGRGRRRPGRRAPSAHPEAAAARRAQSECAARRAAGRQARNGREGGRGREPPPLPARIPAGRMGRFEPGAHAGPGPRFLLP